MATGTWALGWATNDIVSAAEYGKGAGCIYDTTLGAGAASIDVTSIIGSYAHLLVVGYLRSDTAAVTTGSLLRFNGDSAANYGWYSLIGTASSATATAITDNVAPIAAATATAGIFTAIEWLIPHYAGTANFKSVVWGGGTAQTSGNISSAQGVWRSATAINRITVSAGAGSLITGSRFSIYAFGA